MTALNDDRTQAILQGLADTDRTLRDDQREPSFILIRLGRGRAGLKPSFDREAELGVTEADLRDLQDAGYLRELPARQDDVLMKFQLTAPGRAAGARAPVAVAFDDNAQPITAADAPDIDELLGWLKALDATALSDGVILVNTALQHFGKAKLDAVCRLLYDLRDDGLIRFSDPMARLSSWPAPDRIAKGSNFRLTVAGHDWLRRTAPAPPPGPTQNFYAPVNQVAGRDINNTQLTTIQLLQVIDHALATLDTLDQQTTDPQTRDKARSLLEAAKSRGVDVLTDAAGSAASALALSLFHLARQHLGL